MHLRLIATNHTTIEAYEKRPIRWAVHAFRIAPELLPVWWAVRCCMLCLCPVLSGSPKTRHARCVCSLCSILYPYPSRAPSRCAYSLIGVAWQALAIQPWPCRQLCGGVWEGTLVEAVGTPSHTGGAACHAGAVLRQYQCPGHCQRRWQQQRGQRGRRRAAALGQRCGAAAVPVGGRKRQRAYVVAEAWLISYLACGSFGLHCLR